jgi:trans-2-enoyl-CoA reductase
LDQHQCRCCRSRPLTKQFDSFRDLGLAVSPAADEQRRIRLGGWEPDPELQAEIAHRWDIMSDGFLSHLVHVERSRCEFGQLFGFDAECVDYGRLVEFASPGKDPSFHIGTSD